MLKKIFLVLLVFIASSNIYAVCGPNCNLSEDVKVDTNNIDVGQQQEFEADFQAKPKTQETGPTLILGYNLNSKENPIFSFMYFVPMISPTLVEMQISDNCTQNGRFISYDYSEKGDEFTAYTQFEMKGEGHYKNLFDPEKTMQWNASLKDYPKKINKVLDYIKFKGEGVGEIKISGEIENGVKEVTEVKINFDAQDNSSPVTIGIYDVKRENGQYLYENATNRIVARINSLTFHKNIKDVPRMEIELDSISKSEEKAGFFASLKGKFANMFIKPIRVTEQGNQSMLDFGLAITEKKESFTFPLAKNLKQNRDSQNSLALNQIQTNGFRTKEQDNF